jgi:hypothetical protein
MLPPPSGIFMMLPVTAEPSVLPEPYVRLVRTPVSIQPELLTVPAGDHEIRLAVTVTPPPEQLDSLKLPTTLAEATGIKLKHASTTTAVNTKPLLQLLRILFLSLSF